MCTYIFRILYISGTRKLMFPQIPIASLAPGWRSKKSMIIGAVAWEYLISWIMMFFQIFIIWIYSWTVCFGIMAPHPHVAPALVSYLYPASFNVYTPGAWSNPNGWPKNVFLKIFSIRCYPMLSDELESQIHKRWGPLLFYPTPSDASYPTPSDELGSQIHKRWGPPMHPSDAIRRHPTALKNIKKHMCFA